MERTMGIHIGDPDKFVRSGRNYPTDVAEIVAGKMETDVAVTPVGRDGDVTVSFGRPEVHEVFSAAIDAAYRARRAIAQITQTPDAIRQGVSAEVQNWVDQNVSARQPVGAQRR